MSAREVPFEKWSFVDRNDLDTVKLSIVIPMSS